MPTVLQFRRGTTAQNNGFTGSAGELSIDTDLEVVRVHDGSTAGGFAQVGLTASQTLTNKIYQGTSLSVTGNVTGGNLVATTAVSTSSIIKTGSNGVGNIGQTDNRFNTVFATATSALYADLAEKYTADADYPPGTVVEFGGTNELTITTASHSTQVAGVISTNPAYTMNDGLVGKHTAMVALTGRVPCLVLGPIAKGDRLVASDTAGHAQRLDPAQYEPGCIIGKALEHYNAPHPGTIEVAVGRF